MHGHDLCAGHAGKGIASDPAAYGAQGAKQSAEVRSDRAEQRKLRLRDALSAAVEGDLHASILDAYKRGLESPDAAVAVRSADALLSRVYGKPKETVETHTVPDDFRKVREMSTEQREELYQRLLQAEGIEL